MNLIRITSNRNFKKLKRTFMLMINRELEFPSFQSRKSLQLKPFPSIFLNLTIRFRRHFCLIFQQNSSLYFQIKSAGKHLHFIIWNSILRCKILTFI